MVNATPPAIPSPTVAIVCTILFSKIVTLRKKTRKMAMERIAAGIEALMVVPVFRARKVLPMAKIKPKIKPRKVARQVNSGRIFFPGTKGLKEDGSFSMKPQ